MTSEHGMGFNHNMSGKITVRLAREEIQKNPDKLQQFSRFHRMYR